MFSFSSLTVSSLYFTKGFTMIGFIPHLLFRLLQPNLLRDLPSNASVGRLLVHVINALLVAG